MVFNARFATYAVAIAVLGGIALFGKRHASAKGNAVSSVAVVALNLLALIALTGKPRTISTVKCCYLELRRAFPVEYTLVRGFTYSAIWLIYGAVLMAIGFRTRSAFVRWQSLILIAFTTAKVFLYDVSQLGGSYRIVSFIALGAVLLGISFIYQRDWLKLSHARRRNPWRNKS